MPTTLKEFEAIFPSLVEDLSQHAISYSLPENALKWYQDVRKHSLFSTLSYHSRFNYFKPFQLMPLPHKIGYHLSYR